MLLKEPSRVEKRCPRRWSLAAAGGLFALAILVGGVGLRADAAQVVVIVPAPDGKPGQPDQEKKVRVLVVPGPENAPRVKVVPGDGQHRKVLIHKEGAGADKPAEHGRGERVKILRNLVGKEAEGGLRLNRLHVEGDLHRGQLHKLLRILEQQPGAAEVEAVRKQLRSILVEFPERGKVRAIQQPDKVLVLGDKHDDAKARRGTEAALKALRKALDKLGQKPELEAARQQLKKAIEQLEQARKGDFGMGLRLDLDAGKRPELRFAPGKGAQGWNFGAGGGGFWAGPGKPVDAELLKKIRQELKNKNFDKAEELLKKALEGAQGPQWQQFNPQFGQQMQEWQRNFNRQMQDWQRQFNRQGQDRQRQFGRVRASGHGRLGVAVEKPSDALADQLNLPAGKGLILKHVEAGSPAAKAGLKANDVLLELNGQPVPSDPEALARTLNKTKGGSVSAVVLRKGKRETVKDIALHDGPGGGGRGPGANVRRGGGPGNVMTTLMRSGDRFTTRYQEGSLMISLTGTVEGGKAKVGEIRIQDGREAHKYDSAERVPAPYRDRVNHLIEMSGSGGHRIQGRRE